MRKVEDIVGSAFTGWDGKKLSEPAVQVIQELATDARFDEITQVLHGFRGNATGLEMNHIVALVPGVIFGRYMVPSSGVALSVLEGHWNPSGMANAVMKAAMREGLLHITVEKVVERLKEIERAQAQQGVA